MAFSGIALVALAAAQAAAPASSGVQWKPLTPDPTLVHSGTAQPVQVSPNTIPAQPVEPARIVAPVVAQPVRAIPSNLVLWRNIESAMPVAKLRALYPAGSNVTYKGDRTVLSDVPIIEGCQAKVNIMHPEGVVKEIVMRGEGAIAGRCSLKIITALSGKYGEPLDKDKVHGSLFGREGKNYIWMHDGVTLQFKRYTNGPFGGGGLLAASWELRYSTNATNIDL
jgi:hypothetical protein